MQEGRKVHARRCHLQLLPIQLIQIYDVVEDVAEGHGAQIDGIEVLALLLVQTAIQQDAAQTHYAIERRAQLVADGGDEGGLVTARLFQLLLVTLALGHIPPEPQQTDALATNISQRHLAHLETGLVTIGIDHPLLIGMDAVLHQHLAIGLQYLFGDGTTVDVPGREANQLILTAAGQLLHGVVATGELSLLVAVVDQIRRAVDEGADQGAALLQLGLGLLTARHLGLEIGQNLLTRHLDPPRLLNLLIQLGNVALQLDVHGLIPLPHLLQLAHHLGQALPGILQLIHHGGEEVGGPGRDQQTEEDRADYVDRIDGTTQQQGDPHLNAHRQQYDEKSQQQTEANDAKTGQPVYIILGPGGHRAHRQVPKEKQSHMITGDEGTGASSPPFPWHASLSATTIKNQ